MSVHRSLSKYLLLMLITLIFGVGMAFGGCPCNDVDQSVPNSYASVSVKRITKLAASDHEC